MMDFAAIEVNLNRAKRMFNLLVTLTLALENNRAVTVGQSELESIHEVAIVGTEAVSAVIELGERPPCGA